VNLLTNLVWYWDLSSADATITDQHSGLTLSRIGTTTTDATGGPDGGPCISFGNAAGKYRNASVAKTISYDDGYTVNIWVRSTASGSVLNMAVNHRALTGSLYFQLLARRANGNDQAFTIDATPANRIAQNAQESLNTWQMLTLRDTGTTTELYRNGVLVATSSTVLGARSTAAAEFAIGGEAWNGTIDGALNHRGQLAMAGVWNEPLSQSAITALYNSGAGRRYSDLVIPANSRRRRRSSGGVL